MASHKVHPYKFLHFYNGDWGMYINYKNCKVMLESTKGEGIFKRMVRKDYIYRKK